MSNLPDRSRSPVRPMIGGNPAVTRADVRKAVEAFEVAVRPLIAKGVRHTLHILFAYLNTATLECCPSQDTLRLAAGCNRWTIVQHLKELERLGLITRHSLPVRSDRRGRDSDWFSFDFARVGRPEFVWSPPVEAKPRGRRPVRAADGTFRRAAGLGSIVQGEAVRSFANGADLVEVKASVALDGSRSCRRAASARFQDDLRSAPGVASQWWVRADEAAECAAIDAELRVRGAGLLYVRGWL